MPGNDFGKGIGCLFIVAIIGIPAIVYCVIKAIIWLIDHIQILVK